ncbi:N-acetylmuramoyl-L-alanine amidase family protein [Deinococcus cellulosilyticus]|uniref:N-acetylmuramoyl-L-alanine amidase n=1 Tax=Deinococcus cellulosilyticus (strain DSM 18568 / NBRC 106333 / KACC 11606 / 5516J-15) TaxID=1223518 RepID=A0A511N652_DEIC1|nr:N-acetylmuramoyl-L-alanine amidase [Deinococcus cellulosilyticus]GEM47948.1 N-acetylmuramoyl-L-alanine amidase [Deinococcus cellulosilyticus NBRC 106333 = KACC 11606]
MSIFRVLLLALFALNWAFATPRVGQYEGYTRLVLDLPKEVKYFINEQKTTLTVRLTGIKLPAVSSQVSSNEISSYEIRTSGSDTLWVMNLKHPLQKKYTSFWLDSVDGKGVRLVLDLGSKSVASNATTKNTSQPAGSKTPTARAPTPPVIKKQKLRVVIDAGHGGNDPGMVGFITEKEVTLDVALKLKEILRKKNVEVVLTRDEDEDLSPDKRTDLTARANMANAGTVNVFVSIHVNSGPESAQGVETFIFGETQGSQTRALAVKENGGGAIGESITKQATSYAQSILGDILVQANLTLSRQFAQAVQNSMVRELNAINRGVKSGPLMVLRFARTPAILVEIGFGSHPVEGRKLDNPSYRQQVAESIASGIFNFLHVK